MQTEVTRNRSKNINNITDSLTSPQRQIRDAKLLRNENEAYSLFAKEKVNIFLETIDDPNNLQWTILEYWKNM